MSLVSSIACIVHIFLPSSPLKELVELLCVSLARKQLATTVAAIRCNRAIRWNRAIRCHQCVRNSHRHLAPAHLEDEMRALAMRAHLMKEMCSCVQRFIVTCLCVYSMGHRWLLIFVRSYTRRYSLSLPLTPSHSILYASLLVSQLFSSLLDPFVSYCVELLIAY